MSISTYRSYKHGKVLLFWETSNHFEARAIPQGHLSTSVEHLFKNLVDLGSLGPKRKLEYTQ